MTKEQAIHLCNTIQREEPLFYNEYIGMVSKQTPINTLLYFLGKKFKIDGDMNGWHQSDIDKVTSFLREIADALEQ